jgi:hypothetical protein
MKSHAHFIAIFFILITVAVSSCTSAKKSAVSCPDFSRNRNYQSAYGEKHRNLRNSITADVKRTRSLFNGQAGNAEIVRKQLIMPENQIDFRADEGMTAIGRPATGILASGGMPGLKAQTEKQHALTGDSQTLAALLQASCDTIVLRSGEMIIAKVADIGQREVKYRQCGGSDILFVVNSSDVFMIKHANGSKDYFSQAENGGTSRSQPGVKKTEGFSLAGFFGSLVGLLLAGIPLGIMAVVFGFIGTGKISRHPDRYKGRGFAIAAIIIGFVDIIGAIIAISMMANS